MHPQQECIQMHQKELIRFTYLNPYYVFCEEILLLSYHQMIFCSVLN